MKPASLHRLTRARRQRQDFKAFDALIAAPASGSVTLPANGRFAFVALADAAADTPIATIDGPSTREIKSPEMIAGEALTLDYLERASVVTLESGFDLYVLDEFSKMYKICGGP